MTTSPTIDIPTVADRVLVPVSNPATAEGLLRLGMALATPETGRVVAVRVVTSEDDPHPEANDQLQAVIGRLCEETNSKIELVVDVAPNVARGILDMALERRADLLILGIYGKQEGQVIVGELVEAVARTASINIMIFRGMRMLYGDDGFRQVLVPVDGSPQSKLAAKIGLRLAHSANVLMTACHIHTDATRREQAMGRIEESLGAAGGFQDVRRVVERSPDLVDGILNRAEDDTLVVLGISEREHTLDSWLNWDVPQRLLNEVRGPLVLVKHSQRQESSGGRRLGYVLADLMLTLTPDEQAHISQEAQEMARPTTNFFVLIILSSLIAALGLLLNSAAVIIGAMLIAPLMSPLMGFAMGLTQGKLRNMRLAGLTVLQGVVLTLVLISILGFISPIKTPTDEMLARGSPSLVDLLVAVFSGAAGAFALARKDIPAALAGVAIAAALMPPLCTVGMAFAFGELRLAGGALLLFFTNIISISFAAAVVFIWMGVRLRAGSDSPARYRMRVIVSVVVLLALAVPLTISLEQWVQSANRLNTAWTILRGEFGAAAVLDVDVLEDRTPLQVIATVRVSEAVLNDELRDDNINFVTDAQALLRQRFGVHDLVLYIDARPLISAEGLPANE